MPSRLSKPRPQSKTKIGLFSIHQDYESESDASTSASKPAQAAPTSSPASPRLSSSFSAGKVAKFFSSSSASAASHERSSSRTSLKLASEGTVNATPRAPDSAVRQKPLPSYPTSPELGRMNSTIRPVRSFEGRPSDDSSTPTSSRTSAFSSSVNSNASGLSAHSQQYYQKDTRGTRTSAMTLEVPRTKGAGGQGVPLRPSVEMARSSVEIPQRESSLAHSHSYDADAHAHGGDAARGKTGRMLDKLIAEKEALVRDFKFEKTRADELRQGAKLLADKNKLLEEEKDKNHLEKDLMEARLARKERQVESLQSTIALERARAVEAGERERTWKAEMEQARSEAKRSVEEAHTHVALADGRYNAISSHWRDQGDEVKRALAKMKTQVTGLLEERRRDDDRINTLQDLCDQQDGNIRELQRQKDDITAQHERYKAEQERALHDIKQKARERELMQEQMLREAQEVLHKLKWALNVKTNVSGAE